MLGVEEQKTGDVRTTEVRTCPWYQDYTGGACKFSTANAVHTVFQLPGSVVVGLMNPQEAVLREHWLVLSTAISLLAWGGAAYYLYQRFTK
jgi:hypothetical protein